MAGRPRKRRRLRQPEQHRKLQRRHHRQALRRRQGAVPHLQVPRRRKQRGRFREFRECTDFAHSVAGHHRAARRSDRARRYDRRLHREGDRRRQIPVAGQPRRRLRRSEQLPQLQRREDRYALRRQQGAVRHLQVPRGRKQRGGRGQVFLCEAHPHPPARDHAAARKSDRGRGQLRILHRQAE